MRRPIRTTFLISLVLLLAVAFPLLALMAACLSAGMGLHALLSTTHGKPSAGNRLEPPRPTQDRVPRRRKLDWK